jgi:DNA-binding CsgD family transcriptional regulator
MTIEPSGPGAAAASVSSDAGRAALSEREIEILVLVASGASNKEIAQRLVISPNTVKVHLRNIFGKIGVASRTEAALYAIRAGLAPNPVGVPAAQAADAPQAAPPEAAPGQPEHSAINAARRSTAVWPWAAGLALLAVLAAGSLLAWRGLAPPAATSTAATLPRWSVRAPLPTAREGLAVAVYENQLYALGGESAAGVTGAVERFDPEGENWTPLAPKPLPVADITAAVVGGLIYVPGGRTATGEVSAVLEVYDPRRDSWEQRSPLPRALSAYALAVYEGRVYVFGGWTGEAYVALTYVYDPGRDEWSERTRMPTPRGLAGAAVVGERIYVIGGTDGERDLTTNEAYLPAQDVPDGQPWLVQAPLPEGRSGLGVVGLAGTVHVLGGHSDVEAPPLVYLVDADAWQAIEAPPAALPSHPGVAAWGGAITVLGAQEHLEYQAIYIVLIPVVIP